MNLGGFPDSTVGFIILHNGIIEEQFGFYKFSSPSDLYQNFLVTVNRLVQENKRNRIDITFIGGIKNGAVTKEDQTVGLKIINAMLHSVALRFDPEQKDLQDINIGDELLENI